MSETMENFEEYNKEANNIYTSTGNKILYHPEVIKYLKAKQNRPVVLHIMPTEVCNLKCNFCSVAQRGKEGKIYTDLTMEQIKFVVETLIEKNLKAVILSGGGETVLYPQINELIEYLKVRNLEIGLVTNGVLLKEKVSKKNLDKLTWVRVSLNSLDYLDDIDLPEFGKGTTFGASYIWNNLSDVRFIKVKKFVENSKLEYVRLLPDCNLDDVALEDDHKLLRLMVETLGSPYFHQHKIHKTPKECHLGRVHPVLYTDGNIYPCDSNVLNSPKDDKRFHQDFAICKWNEIREFMKGTIEGSLIDTKKCHNCVFSRQNKILTEIINGEREAIKHLNFL